MQKKLIALAIAGLSSAAFAQSNVTVYGVADMYYASVSASGHGSVSAINSGGLSGSRLGFKGVEDIGNGNKALFVLEYALRMDNNAGVGGAGTSVQNGATLTDQGGNSARQQLVGLTGGWGTAVAGFAQTAGYDFECASNPLAGSQLDAAGKLGTAGLLACGQAGRAQNAVAYISPSFSGFTVAVNHGRVTEGLHYNNVNDIYANLLTGKYDNGPISANLTWAKISGLGALVAGMDTQTEVGLTGAYDFGVAKVYAAYQTLKQSQWSSTDNKWQVSAAFPVGAAAILAQYAANNVKHTAADDNSKAYTLALTYGLSKRTTLYTGYTHISNDNGAAKGAFTETLVASSVSGVGSTSASLAPTAGGTASVFAAGINHKF